MTTRPTGDGPKRFSSVLERNIEALLEHRDAIEQRRTKQEIAADFITRFVGSMLFVYVHLVLVGVWIAINAGLLPIEPFDPTFVILATFASVEAIFLSTFVLITQNRMAQVADRRADLDVQISLLSEHEVTSLITMVSAIARKLGIEEGAGEHVEELKQDVRPEHVLERIEQKADDRS
jgi:uncharacterized membrane protein